MDTKFYATVVPDSNLEIGLTHDKETIKWWKEQSKEAYKAVWENPEALHISEALAKFSVFVGQLGKEAPEFWVNGASFDYPILQEAYIRAGLEFPVPFRKQNCYRTLKNLFPYVKAVDIAEGIKHHSFWDAVYQAKHCEALLGWSHRYKSKEFSL
jgi:hypothetical protein